MLKKTGSLCALGNFMIILGLFLTYGKSIFILHPGRFKVLITAFLVIGLLASIGSLGHFFCKKKKTQPVDLAGSASFINSTFATLFWLVLGSRILPGFHFGLSSFLKWLLP